MEATGDERTLAAHFAEELAEHLRPGEFEEVKRRNAAPEYAGDCCASHDFCDANMAMAAAFERLRGRPCALPCDVEEGKATQARADADLALWNGAWALAKRRILTAAEG